MNIATTHIFKIIRKSIIERYMASGFHPALNSSRSDSTERAFNKFSILRVKAYCKNKLKKGLVYRLNILQPVFFQFICRHTLPLSWSVSLVSEVFNAHFACKKAGSSELPYFAEKCHALLHGRRRLRRVRDIIQYSGLLVRPAICKLIVIPVKALDVEPF